jgi:hypothetical protein
MAMRQLPRFIMVLIAASGAAPGGNAHAVPVVPGAAGFGVSTAAGRGGTVHRVTNLAETGAGSLAACIAASGPRVCVFEIAGTIRLSEELVVRHPNLTIAGQTAPSPGILLRGAGLRIQTSDVLLQHVRVRPGDDPAGPAPGNRDALKIEGSAAAPVRNVVIDHCSFAWSIDEMASAWQYWDNISFLSSIFAQPLHDSLHPQSGTAGDGVGHGYGVLIGSSDGSASLIGNLFAHQVERNPLSRAARFVFVNNVVYNRSNMDIELQSEGGRATLNAIVGNVFIRGRDYARQTPPVYVFVVDSLALPAGSRVFARDNAAQEAGTDPWSVVGLSGSGLTRAQLEVSSAPVWPAGLTARTTADDAVLDHVLATAGARPLDRDSTDERIVAGVRNRTGQIVNCVSADGSARCQKNAGGWPLLPVRTRALKLPANHASLTASGYSNLEIWLHSLSAALEGDVVNGPRPPTEVRAR